MTVAALQTAVRQLPAEERRTFLRFVLSTLAEFAREYADDVLRAVADGVDGLVTQAPPLVRVAVGFGTKLLRFAADRIESDDR